MLLIVISALLGAASEPGCRSGFIDPEVRAAAPTRDSYPTAKLDRPLVLPRFMGSVWASGAYVATVSASGAFHQAAGTLGGAFAPLCNLEIGVDSVQLFTPLQPFNTVSPYVTVSLIEQLALSAGIDVRPWPTLGFRTMRFWLGAPVRWKLAPWLGLVGLERILGADLTWSASALSENVSLMTPFGVLFQPHPIFSIELHARPYFFFVPRVSAQVNFDAEFLVSPVRWFDLKLFAMFAPSAPAVQVTTQLGVAFRI